MYLPPPTDRTHLTTFRSKQVSVSIYRLNKFSISRITSITATKDSLYLLSNLTKENLLCSWTAIIKYCAFPRDLLFIGRITTVCILSAGHDVTPSNITFEFLPRPTHRVSHNTRSTQFLLIVDVNLIHSYNNMVVIRA